MNIWPCCFDIDCTSICSNEVNSNHIYYLRNVQQSEPKTTSFIKSRILHSPLESLGLVIMENGGFMDSRKYYLQRNKDLIVSYIKWHYIVFQNIMGHTRLFQNVTNVIYHFQSPNSLLERTGVCIQTGFTASIIMPEISMSLKTRKKRWNISFIKCRNQDGTGEQPESFHFHSARKEPINGVVKFVSIWKFIFVILNATL